MLVPRKALNGTHRYTAHCNRGAEKTVISSGGGEGGNHQGFHHPWAPPGDGDLIKIPGTDDLGSRTRLAGGGEELVLGEDSLQEDGGGAAGVQIIFKCCDTGGTALQMRYLSGHPPHGKNPGEGDKG